ncbi:uncharacterized protein [Ptychodera flava]|uniref:uncharacterized protein n=1 Tax=Ptychodera flava TaxID=63121 RepID=UPI00396A0DEF
MIKWEKCRRDILLLSSLKIPRCLKPKNFGKLKKAELRHFSDASHYGYRRCSYLRLIDDKDRVSSSLVMGKSIVVPTRPLTIPRLELTAVVISARVGAFLRDMKMSATRTTLIVIRYWATSTTKQSVSSSTDSKTFVPRPMETRRYQDKSSRLGFERYDCRRATYNYSTVERTGFPD